MYLHYFMLSLSTDVLGLSKMLPEQASPENRPDIQKILRHHQTTAQLNDESKMFLDNSYKIKSLLLFHLYFGEVCFLGKGKAEWQKKNVNTYLKLNLLGCVRVIESGACTD